MMMGLKIKRATLTVQSGIIFGLMTVNLMYLKNKSSKFNRNESHLKRLLLSIKIIYVTTSMFFKSLQYIKLKKSYTFDQMQCQKKNSIYKRWYMIN